jgi:hypothetical protein
MKGLSSLLALIFVLTPMLSKADAVIPAGTLIQCTISEPGFSSKTAEVGDPILCYSSRVQSIGRTVLPVGTYLQGRFTDYRDPGHFVGKGWMELVFDRLILQPDRIVPFSAKVVHVPGVRVDSKGRILGSGHATRDTIEWMIPILWPEKVLTLPARGPRPKLKQETRVTLKVMDDVLIPDERPLRSGLPGSTTVRPGNLRPGYTRPGPFRMELQISPGVVSGSIGRASAVAVSRTAAPAQNLTMLILTDGRTFLARDYWLDGSRQLRYVSQDGTRAMIPVIDMDMQATSAANRERGVAFVLRYGSN